MPRIAFRPLVWLIGISLAVVVFLTWAVWPASKPRWPDRRPVGVLFLADHSHASPSNPRGWFNNPLLAVTGAGGHERFRTALFAYADRSIEVLKETHAQGVIVWDLEGEQYPHKTTYIGDPRALGKLAPEMDRAADAFLSRFRDSGFRIGLTIRPQQLVVGGSGEAVQTNVWKYREVLLAKIDYARKRWGATLFYVDSNGGTTRPGEALELARVAEARPDILLIPEHHDVRYYGFSAPYQTLRTEGAETSVLVRLFYPQAYKCLNIADQARRREEIAAAYRGGDIILFPAWACRGECKLIRSLEEEQGGR